MRSAGTPRAVFPAVTTATVSGFRHIRKAASDIFTTRISTMLGRALIVAVVCLAAAGCGGSSDPSGTVAASIGASSCTRTDYYIVLRIDNSKHRLFDCTRNGAELCVVYENGVVQDDTALARLVFAENLSGGKPGCAA